MDSAGAALATRTKVERVSSSAKIGRCLGDALAVG
jgi:hypothetical protein